MIIVHARKHYKALTDSGAAISHITYSTYQLIYDNFKIPIQATTTTLNTADGLKMTAVGMTAFHLRKADFKFTHNFIVCDRLPDIDIILASMFKRNSHHMHGKRTVTFRRMADSSHTSETANKN